jgi:hypothetical protein
MTTGDRPVTARTAPAGGFPFRGAARCAWLAIAAASIGTMAFAAEPRDGSPAKRPPRQAPLGLTSESDEAPAEGGTPQERKARALQRQVTRLRGLEFKAPVRIQSKTVRELHARILEDLDTEYPPHRMEAVQKTGIRLGLFPERFDLRRSLSDLLAEQVAGFYDPKRKELCLVGRTSVGLERLAEGMLEMMTKIKSEDLYAVHELTHALQDQHYDLETLPIEIEDNDDLAMAVKCVVEGEATYVMLDYLARAMGQSVDQLASGAAGGMMPISGKAGAAPEFLKQTLVFPYIAGLPFVQKVKKRGGWPKVSALYADLPASTEQILHPEKYLGEARDVPHVLRWGALASLPAGDWLLIESNVLGEFGIRVLLKGRKKDSPWARAAAGWDGDRYHVYQSKRDSGRLLLLWVSSWDTASDATEFADAYAARLNEDAGEDGGLIGPEPSWRGWRRNADESVWMIVSGKDVYVVDGAEGIFAPEALVAEWRMEIRREALAKVQRVPRKPRKMKDEPKDKPAQEPDKKGAKAPRDAGAGQPAGSPAGGRTSRILGLVSGLWPGGVLWTGPPDKRTRNSRLAAA